MSSGSPDVARSVTAALPVALILAVVALVAYGLPSALDNPRLSASAMFAVLATIVLLGFVAITRRRLPRAGALAAVHALAWTPVLAAGASEALGTEIVIGNDGMRCGTGLMAFLFMAVPIGGLFLFIASIATGFGVARRKTNGAIRLMSSAGVALALIAFVFALSRLTRPDPDTYLRTLVPAGELAVGDEKKIAGRDLRYERELIPAIPIPMTTALPVPGEPPRPTEIPPRSDCQLIGLEVKQTVQSAGANGEACPPVRIRIDAPADLAVYETLPSFHTPVAQTKGAFHPSSGQRTSITPRMLEGRLGPPLGWTIGAGLGGLGGLGLLLFARRLRRRATALSGRDAKHLGDGLVELPSGESIRVPSTIALAMGPVVLLDPEEHAATYRETGTPTFRSAMPGTLDDLRATHTDLIATLESIALAAALLGATPLFVARLSGVL